MKCDFCGSEIKRGTGMMYVKVDGTVLNFCSNRCKTYSILKKEPKKLKWTSKQINKQK